MCRWTYLRTSTVCRYDLFAVTTYKLDSVPVHDRHTYGTDYSDNILQHVVPLLCNDREKEHAFLDNSQFPLKRYPVYR
jgi:hypothetical protein